MSRFCRLKGHLRKLGIKEKDEETRIHILINCVPFNYYLNEIKLTKHHSITL